MLEIGQWVAVTVFGDTPGAGSPMVVVRLASWPSNRDLGALAAGLISEEVTFVIDAGTHWSLRWFGPMGEVPFCGHGALAAAAILVPPGTCTWVNALGGPSSRPLRLGWSDGHPALWMPATALRALDIASVDVGLQINRLFDAGRDYLAVLADESALRSAKPQSAQILALERIGLILCAPGAPASGTTAAFRFFAPRAGIDEDRVSCSVLPPLCALWVPPKANVARFVQCSGIDVGMDVRRVAEGWQVHGQVREVDRGRCIGPQTIVGARP